MSSTSWRGRELLGSQTPRVSSVPSAATSAGSEVIRLAELAGLDLLPWERLVIEQALRQRPDESWAAFEVLLLVCRQNGKGSIVEAVELYMLFVLGLTIYHTAHVMKTSRKAYARLWSLIEATPMLRRRVLGKPQKTAEEIVVELTNGASITFMARGQRAGRGLDDANIVILDEALFLEERTVDAIVPTMSTNAMPQVWYTSSAGVLGSSLLRKLRRRGMARDPRMAFFEWSIEPPTKQNPVDPTDRALWAQANPSLGALISLEYVADEQRLLSEAGFLRERLGVFDEDPDEAKRVIPAVPWAAREDPDRIRPDGPVAFAVAAAWPDAESSAIGVAGRRSDGQLVVQVLEHRRGTSWVISRVRELCNRYDASVVIDPGGPAGHLIEPLVEPEDDELPVDVVQPTMRQVGHASKDLLAAIVEDDAALRHFDQPELNKAVEGAGRRNLGDLWTWQRRGEIDISPLEAVTLAAWQADREAPALSPVSVGGGSGAGGAMSSDLARMGF